MVLKMTKRLESLGQLLVKQGAISDSDVQHILEHQRKVLPFASTAYTLGYCSEKVLASMLSRQIGVPAVVFDHSTIDLNVVRLIDEQVALQHNILPFYQDDKRVFVAVDAPSELKQILRQLEFLGGKILTPHLALRVCLSRAIRESFQALKESRTWLVGRHSVKKNERAVVIVGSPDPDAHRGHKAMRQEVTSSLPPEQILGISETESEQDKSIIEDSLDSEEHLPFDSVEFSTTTIKKKRGPKQVMIVDDDFASRHLLVKVLQPEGFVTLTASTGGEAVRQLKSETPDAIIMDVMLPELDGFQVCRAIKKSKRYRHIPVILMSAVIESGRVTEDVLQKYGADAYLQKPLRIEEAVATVKDYLRKGKRPVRKHRRSKNFAEAMELYQKGKIDAAIVLLRAGLSEEPLSAKHHFVLANLLQKKEKFYEAIDEYEATIDIRPDYFPALTRLAYLYYQKGFALKAIDTWRRSLPYCEDPDMRKNIEDFMRKLIGEMGQTPI